MGILDDFLKNNHDTETETETEKNAMDKATKERCERMQLELKTLTERYDGDIGEALIMRSKLDAARKGRVAMSAVKHGSVVFNALVDRYHGNGTRALSALERINATRATRGMAPIDENHGVRSMAAAKPNVIYKQNQQPLQQGSTVADQERAAESRYAQLSDREQRAILAMRTPGGSHIRSLSKTFELYDAARDRALNGRNGRQFGAE